MSTSDKLAMALCVTCALICLMVARYSAGRRLGASRVPLSFEVEWSIGPAALPPCAPDNSIHIVRSNTPEVETCL